MHAADALFWDNLFERFQMPTPRIPCELQHDAVAVLDGRGNVLNRSGADMTACFVNGAEEALRFARLHAAELAVLKSRSPSCGIREVYDGTFSGRLVAGSGVTAQLRASSGLTLLDEVEFYEALKSSFPRDRDR